MNVARIRVLIVEDDSDFTVLLRSLIENQPDMELCGCAAQQQTAVKMAQTLKPDVVLMDLNLSATRMDGIDAAKEIRLSTGAKVVVLTVFENPEIVVEASKRAFASGYVFKSQFAILPESIRTAARGHTPQEWMIMSMILNELSPAEKTIFEIMLGKKVDLFSSQKTIANQKTNILRKLGLKSQKELVQIFGGSYSF